MKIRHRLDKLLYFDFRNTLGDHAKSTISPIALFYLDDSIRVGALRPLGNQIWERLFMQVKGEFDE